jgi:hypothetical protein
VVEKRLHCPTDTADAKDTRADSERVLATADVLHEAADANLLVEIELAGPPLLERYLKRTSPCFIRCPAVRALRKPMLYHRPTFRRQINARQPPWAFA